MENVHIAEIDYGDNLSEAFSSKAAADEHIKSVESFSNSDVPRIIIHQAARFLWLSDRMDEIAKGRPCLQILFYMIAAETVSKLYFNYEGESKSRYYVMEFFKTFCSQKNHDRLAKAFKRNRIFMTSEEAVNFLYDLRCDVAHRGNYYQLFLPSRTYSGPVSPLLAILDNDSIEPHISSSEIRQIIAEGSVKASQLFMGK